jgi:hypothetical protein
MWTSWSSGNTKGLRHQGEFFLSSALIRIPRAVTFFFHHVVFINIPVLMEAILCFFSQMFTYIDKLPTWTSYSLFTLLHIVSGIHNTTHTACNTCVVSVTGACVQKSRHNLGKDINLLIFHRMMSFFGYVLILSTHQSRLLHESILNFYVFFPLSWSSWQWLKPKLKLLLNFINEYYH